MRVASGGTLVLTGYSVFGTPAAIQFWQAKADLCGIKIIGSTSPTSWPSNGAPPSGDWLMLSPSS